MKSSLDYGEHNLFHDPSCLGDKHKTTPSSTKPIASDLSPSKKLSKLVYKDNKCNSKSSLIFHAVDVNQTSQSSNIVSGVGNGDTYDGNTLLLLAPKIYQLKEKSEKNWQETGIRIQSVNDENTLNLEGRPGKSLKDNDTISVNSIVAPDIQNILKNSFASRGKLPKKGDSRNMQNMRLCNDSLEWSVSTNNSFSQTVFLADSFNRNNNDTTASEITAEKIVEPIANRYETTIDLSWENPVLGTSRKIGIPSLISKNNILKKFDKLYSSCSFTREMLKTVKVIGPVDNKFIACLLHLNESDEMLVLVDQHAAHERIRLENLLNQVGFYSTAKKKINNKITLLSPAARISVRENEMNLLLRYKKEFKNVGLSFSFIRSPDSSCHRVFVYSVPAIFVDGYEYQPEAKGLVVNTEFLKEFIHEQIEFMQSSGDSCNMSSRTIFKALASYACHGAIKFGDKITLSTCKTIMKDLVKCDLPFQCAHGRPTIVPIFKLNFLDGVLKKTLLKPNLLKLKIRE